MHSGGAVDLRLLWLVRLCLTARAPSPPRADSVCGHALSSQLAAAIAREAARPRDERVLEIIELYR